MPVAHVRLAMGGWGPEVLVEVLKLFEKNTIYTS